MQYPELTVQTRFVIALALGVLAGLERETTGHTSTHRVQAGVRTYSLVSLLGFACAWLGQNGHGPLIPVGLLALTGLAIISNLAKQRRGHSGWSSEAAALLTFLVGSLCLISEIWLPMALGITSTVLLSEKTEIEGLVARLERNEFLAILRFLVVTLLILPVLPNKEYTQFRLNPAHVWKVVVVISSIGFVGYFMVKKLGGRYGLWLSGLLGGVVSSTAVAVAMGRFAAKAPHEERRALQAVLLASSVMYIRILVLFGFVGAAFVQPLVWKLPLLSAIGIVLAATMHRSHRDHPANPGVSTLTNPFELTPALIFASLFVGLGVLTTLVRDWFGGAGLVILSFFVGVADIDPFLLSLVGGAPEATRVLVQAILIAMMGNTLAKGAYFVFLTKGHRRATAWRFGLWALLHVPLLFL
jgi:uncharacterized membrane protein (DUF4010 family)